MPITARGNFTLSPAFSGSSVRRCSSRGSMTRLIKAGVICLVFAVSLPLMGRLLAAVISVACALLVGELGYAVYPIWPSLFLSLLTVLPLFAIFNGRYVTLGLIASGLCAGAVAVFRYDMGLLAVSIVSFALLLYGVAKGGWRPVGVLGRTAALLVAVLGRGRSGHFAGSYCLFRKWSHERFRFSDTSIPCRALC